MPKTTPPERDPEDLYASLNWEDNPPINGFYEMMMSLTPERRAELRRQSARQQETPEQRFCRMERYCFRVLCDYRNLLRRWKRDYAPKTPDEDFHPLFVEALQKQDYVDYLLDVLLSPDMEERAAFIIDCGKEVSNLERRMAELAAGDTAGRRTDHARSTATPER